MFVTDPWTPEIGREHLTAAARPSAGIGTGTASLPGVSAWPPPASGLSTAPAPGWHDDPWKVAARRWHDGYGWTGHVDGRARPAEVVLPLRTGLVGIGVLLAFLLLERRFMADIIRPLSLGTTVSICMSILVAYGIPLAAVLYVVGRTGLGTRREQLGFRARWLDLAIGPGCWLAIAMGNGVLIIALRLAGVPFTSNVRGIEGDGQQIPRGLLVILLVFIAPVVEEVIFRGLLLRALRSRLPIWAAVGVQGVLFGAVHATPAYGRGNIGLVLVLSWAGIVLGVLAVVFRRIGPCIVTHMVLNGIVALFVITGWIDRIQAVALG